MRIDETKKKRTKQSNYFDYVMDTNKTNKKYPKTAPVLVLNAGDVKKGIDRFNHQVDWDKLSPETPGEPVDATEVADVSAGDVGAGEGDMGGGMGEALIYNDIGDVINRDVKTIRDLYRIARELGCEDYEIVPNLKRMDVDDTYKKVRLD